jgi:hypothetical protein
MVTEGYTTIVLNGIIIDLISKWFDKRGLTFFNDRLACCINRFGEVKQGRRMKVYYLWHLDHVRMSVYAGMVCWLKWLLKHRNANLLL